MQCVNGDKPKSLEESIEELTQAMEAARRILEGKNHDTEEDFSFTVFSSDAETEEEVENQVRHLSRPRELDTLESMGFCDTDLNERLLKRMKGNLDGVIEKLLEMTSKKKAGAGESQRPFSNAKFGVISSFHVSSGMESGQKEFRKLISFLQSRSCGKGLIALICSRYKVSCNAESPDTVFTQIALNCIFNPSLRDPAYDKEQSRAPPTLMDIEDVRNYRLKYFPDDNGIVKWVQVDALLDGEKFRVTCSVCSSCGSSFSGKFDNDPDSTWKMVVCTGFQDHSRKRSGNESARESQPVCISCFSIHSATGSLPGSGRGLIEKIPGMFPLGVVSLVDSRRVASPEFQSKRKRTTTARWDPTDLSSNDRKSLAFNARPNSLRGRSRSQDAGPCNADQNAKKGEMAKKPRGQGFNNPVQGRFAHRSIEPCPWDQRPRLMKTGNVQDESHKQSSKSSPSVACSANGTSQLLQTVARSRLQHSSTANPSLCRLSNPSLCQVCFEECDVEDLVRCHACQISVHKSCYLGEKDELNFSAGWKCDPCRRDVNLNETVCRVCPRTGGAMKRMYGRGPNDWVHLSCAIWISGLYMEDEVTMELVKGIDNIEPQSFGELCCICGESSGCTIQCTSRECSQRWHPLCGLEAGWHMRISVESDKELAFSRTTLCSQHSTKSQPLVGISGCETSLERIQPSPDERDRPDGVDGKESDLCSCLVPWDGVEFMIQCDQCEIWYHGACVGIQETDISKMDTFVCARCKRPAQASSAEHSSLKDKKSSQVQENVQDGTKGVQASDIFDPVGLQTKSKDLPVSEEANFLGKDSSLRMRAPSTATKKKDFEGNEKRENVTCADEKNEGSSQSGSELEILDRESLENSVESRSSTVMPIPAFKPIRSLAVDQLRAIEDARPSQIRRRIPSQWRETASRLSSRFSVSIKSIFSFWERCGANDSEVDCDVVTCLSRFLVDVLDELEMDKDFVSTQTLHNRFKVYMNSRRQKIPVQLQNLCWFGRYMKSIRGMERTKNSKMCGFKIDIDAIKLGSPIISKSRPRSALDSSREISEKVRPSFAEDADDTGRGSATKKQLDMADNSDIESDLVEESQPQSSAGNSCSQSSRTLQSSPGVFGAKPQSGLRVLYKWNELEWYEGTIGKNKTKASYNKISNHLRYKPSDWWFVIWDDGDTSLILLSQKTKSNWYIFHPEGPKPDLYNKLPVVYTGSRHGVKTERIVREKIISSKVCSSDWNARKAKGSSQGCEGSDSIIEEREGASSPQISVQCEGNDSALDGILTKQGDKFSIIHKGARYSIKNFARLAGCFRESDTESDAMKRIKVMETSESLEAYLESHLLASSSKLPVRRSTSSSSDAGGMHFFDEETPG